MYTESNFKSCVVIIRTIRVTMVHANVSKYRITQQKRYAAKIQLYNVNTMNLYA